MALSLLPGRRSEVKGFLGRKPPSPDRGPPEGSATATYEEQDEQRGRQIHEHHRYISLQLMSPVTDRVDSAFIP